ncbi:MAG: hypothetical protein EZS28_035182 [Streblomastix strix]|uniref:Uncharacterized protein n=1 Tax=Streblomastix strix TaxID=222440 RepID=A0A5J4UGU6_9EUKA|nr:MAG: hypothetical protein EZS28_035182 [Streblomastix strix]
MEESTFRPDKSAQFGTETVPDISTIIPRFIQDLESDNTNLHIPALRRLLDIILDRSHYFFNFTFLRIPSTYSNVTVSGSGFFITN